ncbi:beta-lactamase family protein [Streptomyces sp. NBC_00190]|uniref:serine hydrolase domain-containing protein n=1 Tax=unclassified Streptomyces TaxID=2593676 RepID=UPI002E290D3A|nr:serine hydrolase domain-containing protein [Streptomyces sp. NBC_00190]WSZ44633.1 beta-lactamase family protein [Streptomyces sp. NBC_00868]
MTDVQARVQKAIDRLVETGQETGIQTAAYLHGFQIVDAWAGTADPGSGRRVDGDSLFHSFSTGKGVTATVVHVLAEQGLIDYDTPIAYYWPEFAARGKQNTTVRHALTHSVGVPQMPVDVTAEDLCDWDAMCTAVADREPLWEPGTATGYHAWTFGWILGETIRRATGRTISQVLREDIARPLGVADSLFFGVSEDAAPRLATLLEGNWETMLSTLPASWPFFRAIPNRDVWPTATLGNRPDYLRADIPAGGTMTARAAARMYAALIGEVDGVRLISPERLTQVSAVATEQSDRMFGHPVPKGLGYFLGLPEMGGHRTAFGMHGSGGSIAFADPEHGLAFALTHNRLTGGPDDVAAQTVADEIRAALGIARR